MNENKSAGENHALEKLEQDHYTITTLLKNAFDQLTDASKQVFTEQTTVQELYQNLLNALNYTKTTPSNPTAVAQAKAQLEHLYNEQDQHLASLQTNLGLLLTTTSLAIAQLHEHEIIINHIEASVSVINNHFTTLCTALKQAQDYQVHISKTAHAINDIATKTGLLSINTAILVEKGCASEGLQTIAHEIQTLSEQTKFTSDEITKVTEQFVIHTAQSNQALEQGTQAATGALQYIKDYRDKSTLLLEHCTKIDDSLQKLLDNVNQQQSTLNNMKANHKTVTDFVSGHNQHNGQLLTFIETAQAQGQKIIESNTSLIDALQKETDMLKNTREHVSDFSEKLRTVIKDLHDKDIH